MRSKEEILNDLREGLNAGVINEQEIRSALSLQQQPVVGVVEVPESKPEKLSAVDIMFYIAGIVLFSTIMSVIVQSWSTGNPFAHILLSAGTGAGLWSIAYYLAKSPFQNDVRKGLMNALVLTGSLSVIVGGYIITNEIIGGFSEVNFIAGAITLAILGAAHLGFDSIIKKDFTLLMGIFLCVAAFPALLFGILKEAHYPMDVWTIVVVLSAALLTYATRVVVKMKPGRQKLANAYDALAVFVALASMYASSFSDYGVLWLGVMVASVFGIFYLSIISQNKHLLGNASFFMVLIVITISFKYFSGAGITLSLIMATVGLLGSAAVASGINKKYFKKSGLAVD